MENHTKLFHTERGPFNLEKRRTWGAWASPSPIGRERAEKQE